MAACLPALVPSTPHRSYAPKSAIISKAAEGDIMGMHLIVCAYYAINISYSTSILEK